MIFRALHRLGIPSDVAYGAALVSIAVSIGAWAIRNEKNAANAERLGIFIGLWAPTFMIIGQALQQEETAHGLSSPTLSQVDQTVDGVAQQAGRQAESAVTS